MLRQKYPIVPKSTQNYPIVPNSTQKYQIVPNRAFKTGLGYLSGWGGLGCAGYVVWVAQAMWWVGLTVII